MRYDETELSTKYSILDEMEHYDESNKVLRVLKVIVMFLILLVIGILILILI